MAASGSTLRVEGYQDVMRAFARADKDTKRNMRSAFRDVGDVVKRDAASSMSPVSPKTAAGYKTYVRQRGVAVEQSLRKTTGTRPTWGGYQMTHALLPAMEDNEGRVGHEMERAIDKVCDHFDRGGL